MFVVPIFKRHYAVGIIVKVPKKTEKMTLEHMRSFLDAFDDPFWRDLATIHFYTVGRVQEVGGLQWGSIDFKRQLLRVNDVAIWDNRKKFSRLKEMPKNEEARMVHLNQEMFSVLERQWENRSKDTRGTKRSSRSKN